MIAKSALLCRRALVQYAVAVAAGLEVYCVPQRRAEAAPKISKQAVGYRDQPDGDRRCEKCAQFQPPDACKVVEGQISPQGSCRIFVPIRRS